MGKNTSATEGMLKIYGYDKQEKLAHTITDPDYVSGTGYQIRYILQYLVYVISKRQECHYAIQQTYGI